eukprot:CAMPEP_0181256810 /NCGR_PEP_ID=MMETSP1096-20121128/49908_1 /TAXON_ID=156174 ORGANISM="Chrysochromulina ericina, Strain CCMP281" /NCGR_SAMPLE_ID=MMETSP1096 /ASSEMBLY_ACC=CAM_ASM_000453 /LENGTH=60 /DNA_ID=CAMNT_0023355083 /DNA_START=127 /DNA_END=309 /DNA_ORIENTATION=+
MRCEAGLKLAFDLTGGSAPYLSSAAGTAGRGGARPDLTRTGGICSSLKRVDIRRDRDPAR